MASPAMERQEFGVILSRTLPNADAALYTVASDASVELASGSLCNTTGGAVTVNISLVQSGAAVDATHRVISGYSLAANDSLPLNELFGGQKLGPGDVIAGFAGSANAVVLVVSATTHR